MAIALAEADKYEILEKIGMPQLDYCTSLCLHAYTRPQVVAPSGSFAKSSENRMDS
jgi:hypothetical protein